MNFCNYCNVGAYDSYCICSRTRENCPFVRRCPEQMAYVPLDSMRNCTLSKEVKILPKGMNNIRFIKDGVLFVEIDNFVVEIKNPYDYDPEYVDVININNIYYIKGFEPKKTEMKKKINKEEKKDEENKEDKKSISTIDE